MYLPRPCVKEASENIQRPQNISCLYLFAWLTQIWFNPRTYTQIHTPTVVQEGGGWNPSPSFWYVALFWNDFTFSGKPFILGVVALVEAFDVTNNGLRLGFY